MQQPKLGGGQELKSETAGSFLFPKPRAPPAPPGNSPIQNGAVPGQPLHAGQPFVRLPARLRELMQNFAEFLDPLSEREFAVCDNEEKDKESNDKEMDQRGGGQRLE